MYCIFCKIESKNECSVEHIIPESLGNIKHTLPRGVVCDKCNQYFARKIERPLLESEMFKFLRANRRIPNKRGRIPIFNQNTQLDLPDFRIMSRFIGKVGLEVLAHRTQTVSNWNKEIIDNEDLNLLRDYVRYNKGNIWPFQYRTLYPVNAVFLEGKEHYEVLHEYDLLYTEKQELYIVLALFGVEFVFNMGGEDMEGYNEWLKLNSNISPLYSTKNV